MLQPEVDHVMHSAAGIRDEIPDHMVGRLEYEIERLNT
jgi:hypothetical protein